MRGLDARIKMAEYRVAVAIHGDSRDTATIDHLSDLFQFACESAHEQGKLDAQNDIDEPPAMFSDEQEDVLVVRWASGHFDGVEAIQMKTCTGCQNPHGFPCIYHS